MNLQNLPKRDKIVKRAIIPKLEAFLFFDYDSIELRLLAFYMAHLGQENMAEAFRAAQDIHILSAQAIFQKEKITEEERDIGKTFNYATIYGQGIKKCALILNCSLEEAKQALQRFKSQWPGIPLLQTALENRLERVGYIKTLEGRKLHPKKPHVLLNYLIQGTAAGIMRDALRSVHSTLQKKETVSHIVNAIHDELMLDVIQKEIPWLVEKIPPLMDCPRVSEIVPMEVSVEWSKTNWAEKEAFQLA